MSCSELACPLTWISGKVLRSRGLCGASCSPRANDARGRTATTPIRPPARCSWTGLYNVTTFTAREKSVDRRGVGRSPRRDSSGCTARLQPRRRSKRGARRWQTTPARDPPHRGVCVALVLSKEPAGAGAARSCDGLGRDPVTVSSLPVQASPQNLQRARGEPHGRPLASNGARRRQARTGETPSQPWRPPPLLTVPVVARSTAL